MDTIRDLFSKRKSEQKPKINDLWRFGRGVLLGSNLDPKSRIWNNVPTTRELDERKIYSTSQNVSKTTEDNGSPEYREKPVIVFYYFDVNLPEKYRELVYEAIKDIEDAAPGIQFYYSETAANRIRIFYGECCRSDVGMVGGVQDLELTDWAKKGNILHEFMHALGFLHEHQRADRDLYVKCWSEDTTNYGIQGIAIGRYDANSVMHYPCQDGVLEIVKLWANCQRERLSNGDKIGLNKVYPPAVKPGVYDPKTGVTGLYYCGRHNMEDNNAPFGKIGVDGYSGPNNGPNCPSCRRYGGVQQRCNSEGRLAKQGETGLFYCGTRFDAGNLCCGYHDGVCGPNNGPNCNSCYRLLCLFKKTD